MLKQMLKLSSSFPLFKNGLQRCMSNSANSARYVFETLNVSSPQEHVLHVEINRPEAMNAMNKMFFREMTDCFREIRDDRHCRAVVLSGVGKKFTSGLDLADMQDITSQVSGHGDVARKAKLLQSLISKYQETFNAIELCPKPVIAAIHSDCIGSGVDLICACDIRFCSEDAFFKVKEVDAGMAPDMGTLQRLPRIVGSESKVRELVFSCSKVTAKEAKEMGLVSTVFPTKDEMLSTSLELAFKIAKKSPVAVQGSKVALNFSRDHTIQEGLAFMTIWNMTMLQSEDVLKASSALISKDEKPPKYSKL